MQRIWENNRKTTYTFQLTPIFSHKNTISFFYPVFLTPYLLEAGFPHEGASTWPESEFHDEGIYSLNDAQGKGNSSIFSTGFVCRHLMHVEGDYSFSLYIYFLNIYYPRYFILISRQGYFNNTDIRLSTFTKSRLSTCFPWENQSNASRG